MKVLSDVRNSGLSNDLNRETVRIITVRYAAFVCDENTR
jgi:hypothetical protein